MNALIADNSVNTLRRYMLAELSALYEEREAANIVHELFEEYHGWSRADLVLHGKDRISESEILRLHFALKRLKAGEPIQYILGRAWFMGRSFIVNSDVLIPRPETEELTQLVFNENRIAPKVLDIGTGSGCIAISIALHWPEADVTAIDISEEALRTALRNAEKHCCKIRLIQQDYLNDETLRDHFDIIISNPPYIPYSDAGQMRRQVVDHEPHLALFVPDNDPLVFYRRILQRAESQLISGGHIYFEIHEDLSAELESLVQDTGRYSASILQDMQGKKRFMICTKLIHHG